MGLGVPSQLESALVVGVCYRSNRHTPSFSSIRVSIPKPYVVPQG